MNSQPAAVYEYPVSRLSSHPATSILSQPVDALGNPTGFVLTPGQVCDLDGSDQLLPNITAETVLADKGYDTKLI
jgi:hypothetical protein